MADFRVANNFSQNILHKNAHTDRIRAYTHELNPTENNLGARAKNTYANPC